MKHLFESNITQKACCIAAPLQGVLARWFIVLCARARADSLDETPNQVFVYICASLVSDSAPIDG